jgi:hypothetical protein
MTSDMSVPLNTPLCPAGHLPLKGGDQQDAPTSVFKFSSALSILTEATMECRESLHVISPLEGEMPGRAEGGKIPGGHDQ